MRSVLGLVRLGRSVLSRRGRRALSWFVVAQVLLAILDTVALYLISTIFASGGDTRSIRVEAGATTIVIVVGLFTFRSILSTLSTWHTMQVLSREEVSIGQQNFLAFLNSPNVIARGFELNDLFNVVDRGPGAMVSGVVLSFYSILAEAPQRQADRTEEDALLAWMARRGWVTQRDIERGSRCFRAAGRATTVIRRLVTAGRLEQQQRRPGPEGGSFTTVYRLAAAHSPAGNQPKTQLPPDKPPTCGDTAPPTEEDPWTKL